MAADERLVVNFPTLGVLVADWISHHCPIPDGFRKGQPFELYQWQLECTVNHYRVRREAEPEQLNQAFHYRRSQIIGPQKSGKGPWSASIVCNEAVGPALFAGWAGKDDGYACSDHGCGCGWEFEYEPGEPMGMPWATPLIQLLAVAEDQVQNVYRPLQSMAKNGPLADLMRVGEEFIRLPNEGQIDVVTSKATTRLGAPIIFCLQDESGLYTKSNGVLATAETMRRGAAGMGGRSIETTNAPDQSLDSTAMRTIEAAETQADIYRYHREPPQELGSYLDKKCRRKIHAFAYHGSPHVNLDSIEAEAAEIIIKDPGQAERFFGNRIVAGSGKWTTEEAWTARKALEPITVKKGEQIALGFDGSAGSGSRRRKADATVLVGSRLSDGHKFEVASWEQPDELDATDGWEVPRAEVHAKLDWAFKFYDVVLFGFDPPYWRSEGATWVEKYGEDRVVEFPTKNDQLMSAALERLSTWLRTGSETHDGSDVLTRHVLNAVKVTREFRDDIGERKLLTLVSKVSKDSDLKIDGLISLAIAEDMRARAIAAGARKRKKFKAVAFR